MEERRKMNNMEVANYLVKQLFGNITSIFIKNAQNDYNSVIKNLRDSLDYVGCDYWYFDKNEPVVDSEYTIKEWLERFFKRVIIPSFSVPVHNNTVVILDLTKIKSKKKREELNLFLMNIRFNMANISLVLIEELNPEYDAKDVQSGYKIPNGTSLVYLAQNVCLYDHEDRSYTLIKSLF